MLFLGAAFKDVYDDGSQKYENSDLIDAMHHPEVDIGWFIRIWLLKNTDKIITHFPKFKKFLKSAV
jgi:hypothetical protein